jgi:uncharacterized protein YlxW (UPF0749 family)
MPGRTRRRAAGARVGRPGRLLTLAFVGLLSALVAFLVVVQVRSQAEVVRSLEGQDNTSLAFLIDDLHRANDALAGQAGELTARRERLRTSDDTEIDAALREEAQRLRMAEGLAGVHGPGVVITVEAPLSRLDLEDAVNNLRTSGAEAIEINDHRIVTGSVVRQDGAGITIDGASVRGPWIFLAVGDADRLSAAADLMTRSLRGDDRVRAASYRVDEDVQIRATVTSRPYVYGSG